MLVFFLGSLRLFCLMFRSSLHNLPPPLFSAIPRLLCCDCTGKRASIAAEAPPGSLSQSSSSPASVAVVGMSCSLSPVLGDVPGQDLGAQASALLASRTGFLLQSPLTSTSSSQGRPAFVFPSFISTFAPPNRMLVSS